MGRGGRCRRGGRGAGLRLSRVGMWIVRGGRSGGGSVGLGRGRCGGGGVFIWGGWSSGVERMSLWVSGVV